MASLMVPFRTFSFLDFLADGFLRAIKFLKLICISDSSSSSKVCPLYSGFPSPKTKFRPLSLSLVSSSVSPWFVMLRLTPSIQLSLGLHLLRVPSGSYSNTLSGSLFPGILFTCPNHRSRFSSITSKMFFRTSMGILHTIINQSTRYAVQQ
jgi:hypothetical protein